MSFEDEVAAYEKNPATPSVAPTINEKNTSFDTFNRLTLELWTEAKSYWDKTVEDIDSGLRDWVLGTSREMKLTGERAPRPIGPLLARIRIPLPSDRNDLDPNAYSSKMTVGFIIRNRFAICEGGIIHEVLPDFQDRNFIRTLKSADWLKNHDDVPDQNLGNFTAHAAQDSRICEARKFIRVSPIDADLAGDEFGMLFAAPADAHDVLIKQGPGDSLWAYERLDERWTPIATLSKLLASEVAELARKCASRA